MSLMSINHILAFEILEIDFVGSFPRSRYRTSSRYIITTIEHVRKWEEAEPIESCTKEVAAKSISENIITKFGFPITLISDRGTHFINKTIKTLVKEYMIDHHKSLAYQPQANGAIDSFNKTLSKGLTKICNLDKNDWNDKIPTI